MNKDSAFFLQKMLRNPFQVASILPSSRFLCRRMLQEIDPNCKRLVELGPGTGVVTRQILDKGIPAQNLTLVELDPDFCTLLRDRFPGVRVENSGAQNLSQLGCKNVDAIVSSLPLLAFPMGLQEEILSEIFKVLAPGGLYVQFTYGLNNPVNADIIAKHRLQHQTYGRVWANLPPAQVYAFRQIQH